MVKINGRHSNIETSDQGPLSGPANRMTTTSVEESREDFKSADQQLKAT